MKRLLLTAMLCACAAAPASGNLIQNGSFEQANIGFPPGTDSVLLRNGSTAISGWMVLNNAVLNIDYVGGFWTAAEGTRSLDLNGTQPGGVEQTFDTQIGTTYLVSFMMAGNPSLPPEEKTMDVSAYIEGTYTPFDTGSFSFHVAGKTTEGMGWTEKQWTFVADSLHTTLRFMSTTRDTQYGPALDDVSVVAVPLPASVLLGVFAVGWAGRKLRQSV